MKLLLLVALVTGIGAKQLVLINPTQKNNQPSGDDPRYASNAIDGDESTEYHSTHYDSDQDQWIQFDLEYPSIIDTVTILGR